MSVPPLTSHLDQIWEAEDEKNMEELSVVPSAISEPRWALHTCDSKCRRKSFKFFEIAATVSEEGGAAHTINLCRKCYNARRVKHGEAEVADVER